MKEIILNKLQANPVAQQMLQFGNNIGNLFPNEEALCMASAFMQDKQTRIVVKKNRYAAQQHPILGYAAERSGGFHKHLQKPH